MQRRFWLLDTLLKYTAAAIFIGVPLYPKFPFLRIPGTFVAIRFEDFLLSFAAVILAIIYIPKMSSLLKEPVFHAIFIFLITGLVSLISAALLTKTFVPYIGFLHWMRRIEYFVPLFLGIESVRRNKANLGFYLNILVLLVIFVFLYGFGQKNLGWPIIITQNEEYSKGIALRWIPGSHINSTFAGHYDLATFLVLALPIIICSFYLFKDFWGRVFLTLSAFAGLWLLVNTASRISLISYLVAASTSLILIRRHSAIPVVIVVSLIFVGFSSNLLARYVRIFEVFKGNLGYFYQTNYTLDTLSVLALEQGLDLKRNQSTPTPSPAPVFEDRSTNIRLNVEWPRALRGFSKNPLLGTGYSSITLATDNDFLRLLGEVGVLGALAFSLIFIKIFEQFIKVMPYVKNFKDIELVYVASLSGSLPGLFLNALFIDIFEASKFAIIFWLFIGMVLGLMARNVYE